MPGGQVGIRTQAPSPAGYRQLLSGDRAHFHTQVPQDQAGHGAPPPQKVDRCPSQVGLQAPPRPGWPSISQPVSAPLSSTDWGHNDLYLAEVDPKSYLILYMINQYNDDTSLVAHLMGMCGPFQSHPDWLDPGPPLTLGMGLWPPQQ